MSKSLLSLHISLPDRAAAENSLFAEIINNTQEEKGILAGGHLTPRRANKKRGGTIRLLKIVSEIARAPHPEHTKHTKLISSGEAG